MAHLDQIHVAGFKSIRDQTVELGPARSISEPGSRIQRGSDSKSGTHGRAASPARRNAK